MGCLCSKPCTAACRVQCAGTGDAGSRTFCFVEKIGLCPGTLTTQHSMPAGSSLRVMSEVLQSLLHLLHLLLHLLLTCCNH